MNDSLKGLTAVVFGGSSHVGAGIVRELAKSGASVVIQYRSNSQRAEAYAEEIRAFGGTAMTMKCDGTDEASVKELFSAVKENFGGIDILVNAAHPQTGMVNVSEMVWEDFAPHISAWKLAFLTSKSVLPYLAESACGRIIYISGGLSKRHMAGTAAYSAAKGGLNNFYKTLALEAASDDITVNIIAPGRVSSEEESEGWKETDEKWGEYTTPLPHNVTPTDVGNAVVFYAQPSSRCVTGQTLYIASGEILA